MYRDDSITGPDDPILAGLRPKILFVKEGNYDRHIQKIKMDFGSLVPSPGYTYGFGRSNFSFFVLARKL